MNLEQIIAAVDRRIPIHIDKLRVMTEGNQDKKLYRWIQDQYPHYKNEYERILFQHEENYYHAIIEQFRNDKRIVFMSDVWGV